MHLRSHLLRLRAAFAPSSHIHCSLLLFSTSTTPASFSLESYLVTACGLSPDQARKASAKAFKEASSLGKKSKELRHSCLSSATNPDSVLALLSGAGLSRPEIAAVIAADPLLLRNNVEDVATRLAAFRDRLGLSAPQIASLLLVSSRILCSSSLLPNLEFLIPFFASFDKLLPVVKSTNRVLTTDLEKVVKPNIALLRHSGLSNGDIVKLYATASGMLIFNPKRVEEFVLRADELGVPRGSGMFKHALAALACINQGRVAAKMELFKSTLGCSEAEVGIAVRKQPRVLGLTVESFRRKSDFLINEMRLEPGYIVERPVLLMFSVDRRLAPRHYVFKVLQAKGLLKNCDFYVAACLSEEKFKSKFVACHENIVPGLADAYATACAGEVPCQVEL